jgi:vancomycin resistance protein YoaR
MSTVPFARVVLAPPASVPRRMAANQLRFPFRLLLLLSLLPFLFGASVLAVYYEQHADRIYPGVSAFGVSLSGLTREQAAQAIKRRLREHAASPFFIRYDDVAVQVTLAAMGMQIDDGEIERLVDRAYGVGRAGGVREWLSVQLSLLRHGHEVSTQVRIDPERTTAVLGRVALDVERPAVNAGLAVEKAGDRFEIHTSPAQTGRRLNVAGTIEQLQASLANGLPTALDLVLDEARPSITDADLLPAVETIQQVLSGPLELVDGSRRWRLDPAALHGMLEITGLDTGRPPVEARVNEAKLREFVERTARAADQPARNPTLAIDGEQVVIRPGSPGRLVDVEATFERTKQKVVTPDRQVEIAFVEDQPWLAEADLEPARDLANVLLERPIILETPALPGIAQRTWRLERPQLVQLLALPDTQQAPRNYAELPPVARPRFDVQLDSGKVTNFLAREVAPWVSEDPVDARLELRTVPVSIPNPAQEQRRQNGGTGANGGAGAGNDQRREAPADVAPTITETRHVVELVSAREGRGPDYLATFAAMQIVFRAAPPSPLPSVAGATSGSAAGTPTPARPTVTPTPARPAGQAATPTARGTPVGTPAAGSRPGASPEGADEADRRVTVRLAPRAPRVVDADLASARDQANTLIGEPITVQWQDARWTVTRAELAGMLRYQQAGGQLSAYLTRDGLLAKAAAIAREAERRPDAPRDSQGRVLPVDVPATAAAIWQQALTKGTNRVAEVVWTEEPPEGETAP